MLESLNDSAESQSDGNDKSRNLMEEIFGSDTDLDSNINSHLDNDMPRDQDKSRDQLQMKDKNVAPDGPDEQGAPQNFDEVERQMAEMFDGESVAAADTIDAPSAGVIGSGPEAGGSCTSVDGPIVEAGPSVGRQSGSSVAGESIPAAGEGERGTDGEEMDEYLPGLLSTSKASEHVSRADISDPDFVAATSDEEERVIAGTPRGTLN